MSSVDENFAYTKEAREYMEKKTGSSDPVGDSYDRKNQASEPEEAKEPPTTEAGRKRRLRLEKNKDNE